MCVREGSLLKLGRLQQTSGEDYTRLRKLSGNLVWRTAHRRTGGSGDEHSEVTDNLTSLLVFGDSRKPPEYGRVFSRTASKKFLCLYTDYERGVKQSNKEQTVK